MMGYAREELLQMSVADVLAPHERPRLNTEPALMMSGQPHLAEWLHQRKDGSTWPAEVRARRLGEGQYLAIFRDLTERKQAEEALHESEARLRMSVQLAQEAERLRIARELHDELGQLLTGLKMEMSGIAHKLRRDQAALHEPVAAALDLLDSSIVSVRKIATELRPGLLDALGLAAAIEWQVEEFQARTGVSCSLTLPREKLALPDDQATALFRILQEALTNIARHAQAKHAEVRLAVTNGSLVLEVRDDGRGIRPEERVKARSLGIVGMRERALLLGGEVAVTGRPGGGTTVRASVPLEPPAAARKPA
jgi:signal transduction histidine kinase